LKLKGRLLLNKRKKPNKDIRKIWQPLKLSMTKLSKKKRRMKPKKRKFKKKKPIKRLKRLRSKLELLKNPNLFSHKTLRLLNSPSR